MNGKLNSWAGRGAPGADLDPRKLDALVPALDDTCLYATTAG